MAEHPKGGHSRHLADYYFCRRKSNRLQKGSPEGWFSLKRINAITES